MDAKKAEIKELSEQITQSGDAIRQLQKGMLGAQTFHTVQVVTLNILCVLCIANIAVAANTVQIIWEYRAAGTGIFLDA